MSRGSNGVTWGPLIAVGAVIMVANVHRWDCKTVLLVNRQPVCTRVRTLATSSTILVLHAYTRNISMTPPADCYCNS